MRFRLKIEILFEMTYDDNRILKTNQVLVVRISETKFYDFYHSEFSDSCFHLYFHIHNVSSDQSSGHLQVFLVDLWSQDILNEVKIIDTEEYWRIKHLKESAHVRLL